MCGFDPQVSHVSQTRGMDGSCLWRRKFSGAKLGVDLKFAEMTRISSVTSLDLLHCEQTHLSTGVVEMCAMPSQSLQNNIFRIHGF